MARTLKEFSRRLVRLADKIGDMREPFADIAEATIDDVERRIDRGVDQSGAAFAPLSEKYAKRKAKKFPGKPILKRTNHMVAGANISTHINRQSVRIRYESEYAAYHQDGTGKMPKREFAGVSAEAEREADRIIESFVDKLLGGL